MEKNSTISNQEVTQNEQPKQKKKGGLRKYFLYIALVLIATGLSLFLSLRNSFDSVIKAFSTCDWKWIGIILGVVAFYFLIDSLVIVIFMRLYTRKYHLHQGAAVAMIGAFYSGITPGASGGQVMQAYTLKKQGTQISNAASLLVMYFILYQVALILLDIVTVAFKWNLLFEIGTINITLGKIAFNIPLVPFTILGFLLNLSLIGLFLLMSYSHRIHNFIMHYGVGLFAKLRIVKQPDKARETLRIQVENFKIELRRLLSNFRISFLIVVLFLILLICKFSIPWFAGMAIDGYGISEITGLPTTGGPTVTAFFDSVFMSSYHQMITGLIPLPGNAGVSEVFFNKLFYKYYINDGFTSAAQIIWRTSTFYLVMLVSGFVSAFYKASPKEQTPYVSRRTFVTLQFETYEERKLSSDTSYETTQLSRKELQNRLKGVFTPKIIKEKKEKQEYKLDDEDLKEESVISLEDEIIPEEKVKERRFSRKKKEEEIEWRDLGIK